LTLALAGRGGALLVRALMSTVRVHFYNAEELVEAYRANRPVIYCFWHGRMIVAVHSHRFRNIGILISQHRDGEYVHQVASRLGYQTFRGSSTRGGARGVLRLIKHGGKGHEIAITPDGPQGPRYQVQAGIIYAAMKSGLPIVPAGIALARYWQLPSWDKFQVPKPFTDAYIDIERMIHVPADLDEESAEQYRQRLQEAMAAASRRAEERAGGRFEI